MGRYKNNLTKEITWVDDENGCHICTSHSIGTHGYPQCQYDKKRMNMSRYVYEQSHGKIAHGLVVRHKCDNRMCININHLELGSCKDNSQDMVSRNRQAKGESNSKSKLSELQVIEIRQSDLSSYKLADAYNVTRQNIREIQRRKTWKHIA